MIRILTAGDEALLSAFLERHADSSMFLRANSQRAGLVDRGEPLQGTYAALVDGGELKAVAAHCWNGMLLVQAPVAAGEVARAATQATGRKLGGIGAPWKQAQEAAAGLGAHLRGVREVLYALDLADLRDVRLDGITARRPREDELELIVQWREAYLLETGLAQPGPDLQGMARGGVALWHALGNDWALERGGRLVAYTGFNARLPDIAQIGGVWTPPELRGQHLARTAVATHLRSVAGLRRAVLFTQEDNLAARKAYESLGFRAVGDYGLLVP